MAGNKQIVRGNLLRAGIREMDALNENDLVLRVEVQAHRRAGCSYVELHNCAFIAKMVLWSVGKKCKRIYDCELGTGVLSQPRLCVEIGGGAIHSPHCSRKSILCEMVISPCQARGILCKVTKGDNSSTDCQMSDFWGAEQPLGAQTPEQRDYFEIH